MRLIKINDNNSYIQYSDSDFYCNIGVIHHNNKTVLYDCGIGYRHKQKIDSILKENNFSNIVGIVISHHHDDHSFNMSYYSDNKIKFYVGKLTQKFLCYEKENLAEKLNNLITQNYFHPTLAFYVCKDNSTHIKDYYPLTKDNIVIEKEKEDIYTFDDKYKLELYYFNNSFHDTEALVLYDPQTKVIFLGDSCYISPVTPIEKINVSDCEYFQMTIENIDFEKAVLGHQDIISRKELITYLDNNIFILNNYR